MYFVRSVVQSILLCLNFLEGLKTQQWALRRRRSLKHSLNTSVRALHFQAQDTATELTGCLAAAAAAAAAAFIPAVGYILCQQRILLLPAPRPPDAAAAAAAAGAALPPGVLLRLLWLLLLLVCRVLRGPAEVLALA